MGEYDRRKCTENKEKIKNSSDPYEIMRIVFEDHRTQYSDELEAVAASRMTNLVRHDDTRDNEQGLIVIHAVLDMMHGKLQDQGRQQLGCEIF